MKKIKQTKPLNDEGIAEAIELITEFFSAGKCDEKEINYVTFAVEEALLRLRGSLGDEHTYFHIHCTKYFVTYTVTVTVNGKNVIEMFKNDDNFEIPLNRILSLKGINPEYSYESGTNKVKLEIKAKAHLTGNQKSIIAVAIGALFGFLALLLPDAIRTTINTKIVSPIFYLFIQIIASVSALMIFLKVTQSIYLFGDKKLFVRVGKRFFTNVLGKMLLLSAICSLVCIPIFHSEASAVGGKFDAIQTFELLLQMIPTNFISPFLNGDILQILLLSIFLGVVLLLIGNRVSTVTQLIDQCDDIVNHIMEYILRWMPIPLGISIFTLIAGNEFSSVFSIIKLIIVAVVFIVIVTLWNFVFPCLRWKKNTTQFRKDTMPVIIRTFSTPPASATMPICMEICEKKFNIDKKLVTFGIPVNLIMFKPASVIYRVILSFGLAEVFGVAITPVWIFTCILLSFFLSIVSPAVPNGGMSTMLLLFTQLGIPTEALALALVYDIVIGRLVAVSNTYCAATELINISEILKNENKTGKGTNILSEKQLI